MTDSTHALARAALPLLSMAMLACGNSDRTPGSADSAVAAGPAAGGSVAPDTVTFPETDLAAIGAGYGFDAVTVRRPDDVAGVRAWAAGPRDRPLLVDAKVASPRGSWWLEDAFRGH